MNKETAIREIELLAPARDADVAICAINAGADAIYIGPPSHGARRAASNSIDDIRRVVEYAHLFDVKVYVTLNTLVYESELADVETLIAELYHAGVDALIVQDLSILRMEIPPIQLHASTQCDIRTPEKALFYQNLGFSQLVVPRELSLMEIRMMASVVEVPLEGFVHGALCVSYSGDCQASFIATGRSANRGECAQICRYAFDLEDGAGNKLMRDRHLLSLRDMNRLGQLGEMLDAGISSFKIEGRLKDEKYVKVVTAAYSEAFDRLIAENPGRWKRSSRGSVERNFRADPADAFNRGFTSYFLKAPAKMASILTPKSIGRTVGKVVKNLGPTLIQANLTEPLNNGDGLGFFDKDGHFCGFRLNRADGNRLHTATPVKCNPGAELYRNFNKQLDDELNADRSSRKIEVEMAIEAPDDGELRLTIMTADGKNRAVVFERVAMQPAKTPQEDTRFRNLTKLGGEPFVCNKVLDKVGDLFCPASVLASLRRSGIAALKEAIYADYMRPERRKTERLPRLPEGYLVSRHDNISNSQAAAVYRDAGARGELPAAIECRKVPDNEKGEIRVMQTRYCLRRELGACLKTPSGSRLPSPLYLTAANLRYRLDFDCKRCGMNVIAVPDR